MTNVESLIGSNFTDSLSGNEGFNFLLGSGANDALDGRAGFDVAFFPFEAVTASLVTRRAQGEGTDTLGNFEGLAGSARNDRLIGDGSRTSFRAARATTASAAGAAPTSSSARRAQSASMVAPAMPTRCRTSTRPPASL